MKSQRRECSAWRCWKSISKGKSRTREEEERDERKIKKGEQRRAREKKCKI